jgi:hypothetical protein
MRLMSSTHGRGAVVARRTVLACVLFAWCPCAFALNPALDVSQYAHTAWRIRDGFTKGIIKAIAQTPDGYLWLGTEFGLLRFDGVRNVPWQPPPDQPLPDNFIWSLLVARDGTLWIGTSKGLASWKDGKLARHAELDGLIVQELLEDRDGSVWAGGAAVPTGRLCAFRKTGVQCYGEDGRFGWAYSACMRTAGVTSGREPDAASGGGNPGPPHPFHCRTRRTPPPVSAKATARC